MREKYTQQLGNDMYLMIMLALILTILFCTSCSNDTRRITIIKTGEKESLRHESLSLYEVGDTISVYATGTGLIAQDYPWDLDREPVYKDTVIAGDSDLIYYRQAIITE